MKILWLSNKVFSDKDTGSSGTWLDAMAQRLIVTGEVELCNISMGAVKATTRQNAGQLQQWIVPISKLGRDGLPLGNIIVEILKAIEEFDPDIVHVWGVESYWGLLTARKYRPQPALLEMQGLKGAYARVYNGGLTVAEQGKCIGLKEILRQSTIYHGRRNFEKWAKFESEMIAGHRYITTQTDWMLAQVKAINPNSRTFHMDLALRPSFITGNSWARTNSTSIFCSAAYPVPYKGLHIAIKAAAILKRRFPNISLRIAGGHQRYGIRRDGYVQWLNLMIDKLGIAQNVAWLGPLTADQIIHEMHAAAAMAIPTFIENCCTAMQEAMMIGIPVVASYAGGLPSLARDEDSALFFPTGDAVMCAHQLERILIEQGLANKLSHNARAIALARNNPETIVKKQLEIYQQVLNASAGANS